MPYFFPLEKYFGMATKKAEAIDVRDLIVKKLSDLERNLHWLHKKTKIPYGTLYSSISLRHFQVSQENLDKINTVLETDYKLI